MSANHEKCVFYITRLHREAVLGGKLAEKHNFLAFEIARLRPGAHSVRASVDRQHRRVLIATGLCYYQSVQALFPQGSFQVLAHSFDGKWTSKRAQRLNLHYFPLQRDSDSQAPFD